MGARLKASLRPPLSEQRIQQCNDDDVDDGDNDDGNDDDDDDGDDDDDDDDVAHPGCLQFVTLCSSVKARLKVAFKCLVDFVNFSFRL